MPIIKDDDRWLDPGGIAMALETKAEVESHAVDVLEGRLHANERGPKDLRPSLPDDMRGYLLRGSHNVVREPVTREECLANHERLISLGYRASDAPCFWFDPATRQYVNIIAH